MGSLLACPFCRTLYAKDEASICPQCDLRLVPLSRLPPSAEALEEAAQLGETSAPEDQTLSVWFLGRGRGAALGLAGVGLWLFFQPWAHLQRPDDVLLSGFDLARGGATWLFGGAIAWFLLLPLLLSRRTVRGLIGARVVVVTGALMTVGETLALLFWPPAESVWMRSGLSYQWGLDASLVVALLGVSVGLFLGGGTADLRDLPLPQEGVRRRPSETLH